MEKMKILLINPTRSYNEKASYISKGADIGLPLGILYIAAVLDKEGYDVEVLDSLVSPHTELKQISGDRIEYGIPWDKLKDIIKQKKADIIGISNMFSAQINNTIRTTQLIKKIDKNIPVIVGGPHITVKAAEFLQKVNTADVAVTGEGEIAMLDLVKCYEKKADLKNVNGIVYRNNGKIISNNKRDFIKDLDELPLPAYHLIDMESYLTLYKKNIYSRSRDEFRSLSMVTSRGCPYNCVFCSIHLHTGRAFRPHSAEYIIKHLKHVVEKYNVKQIHFEDDNFTLDIKRCEQILDGIISNKLDIKWDTPNGIRADIYSRSLVEKMKRSGCKSLTLGIESGDQDVIDNIINKSLDLSKVEGFAKLCKEFKIPVNAFYVIGFPGETKKNIKKTIDFALMLQNKYGVMQGGAFFATPLYGTRLYKICEEKGYFTKEITPESLAAATASYGEGLIKTPEFTPDDLKKFNQILIRANYLKHLKNPLKQVNLLLKNPKILLDVMKRFMGK
jgi:magnesium-protoporphyrin IX monomethyl ester (oxidative) cyclase